MSLGFQERMEEQMRYYLQSTAQAHDVSREVVENDLAVLRPGIAFSLASPKMEEEEDDEECPTGGINRHYKIQFEDGVCWMLRVRQDMCYRKDRSVPLLYREDVEREANALIAMRDHGIKTVPLAYLPPPSSVVTPNFPTAHLYLDYAPGHAMPFVSCPLERNSIDLAQARRYMESYADHQIALASLRFDALGQLIRDEAGKIVVGPMLPFPLQGDSVALGPFDSLGARLIAFIDHELEILRNRDWKLVAPLEDRLWQFFQLLDTRRVILGNRTLAERRQDHYLKHADDKPDQYLALDGRLSAVLDWEGVYTTTKEEAFMAPSGFCKDREDLDLSRDEELLIEIYIEKGRPDLADCVRQGPVYRLLNLSSRGCTSVDGIRLFKEHFGAGQAGITIPASRDEWEAECLESFKDEPSLSALMARHRECQAEVALMPPRDPLPASVKTMADFDKYASEKYDLPSSIQKL